MEIVETYQDLRHPGSATVKLDEQPIFAFTRDIAEHAQSLDQPHPDIPR
jgi:hypothetical protein